MIRNYEYRFELKPGRFVYLPTSDCRTYGERMIKQILARWQPEAFFYHILKAGGHVAAMRPHLKLPFHASIDLSDFFTSVSRTRVHRALVRIGFRNRQAFDIATESCVEANGRKFLPYGFPQSMLLATLVFEKSALGAEVRSLREQGLMVTVYVDDILISSGNLEFLKLAYEQLLAALATSGFQASSMKSEKPGDSINSFNCSITDRIELRNI